MVCAITKTELENTNLGVKGWAAMQPVQPHGLKPSPKATASGSKKNGIPEVAGEVKTLISSYQESTLELTSLTDERKETPEAWVSCTAGFDAAAAICATHDQKLVAMSTEEKAFKSNFDIALINPKKLTDLKKGARFPILAEALKDIFKVSAPKLKLELDRIRRIKRAADGADGAKKANAKKAKKTT